MLEEKQEIAVLHKKIAQLERNLKEQSFLVEMTNLLIAGHDLETTIKNILQLAMNITGSEAGCIYITDNNIGKLKKIEVNGTIPQTLVEALGSLNERLGQHELYKIIEVNENNHAFSYYSSLDCQLTSFINIPLVVDKFLIGYAVVMHRHEEEWDHPNHYSSSDFYYLQIFASQAALLLDNTRLKIEQGKKEMYLKTISSFISAIDAKDIYTENHSRRVAKMTVGFARYMGLEGEMIEKLQYGALLHDIGKIGIADAILNKPAPLSNQEYNLIKQHPLKGLKILAPMEPDETIISIIKHHHEWYNGNGYPDGLKGEAIPFAARLVSIVDAWDAMTSDRSYRQKLSLKQTIREFQLGSGKQFDPNLVKSFIKLLYKKENKLIKTG